MIPLPTCPCDWHGFHGQGPVGSESQFCPRPRPALPLPQDPGPDAASCPPPSCAPCLCSSRPVSTGTPGSQDGDSMWLELGQTPVLQAGMCGSGAVCDPLPACPCQVLGKGKRHCLGVRSWELAGEVGEGKSPGVHAAEVAWAM